MTITDTWSWLVAVMRGAWNAVAGFMATPLGITLGTVVVCVVVNAVIRHHYRRARTPGSGDRQ